MAVTFTADQQKVIDLRDCNILVSAAAGSGKTAVLTERIVQRVCDTKNPVQIDRMLIVTFTNAAAAEMRERIGVALRKRLDEEPDNSHLRRQMTLLNNAQITTIDSFCLYLLRNHFHEIQLDPGFRIADEGEIKLLKQEILEDYLEDKYAEGKTEFLELIEKYAGTGNEEGLKEIILKIYAFSQSHPFPTDYLKDCMRTLKDERELPENLQNVLHEYEQSMLEECIALSNKAIELCKEPGGPYHYEEAFLDDLDFYLRLKQASSYEERSSIYGSHKYKTLSRSKVEDLDENIKNAVKDIRDKKCKKIIDEIRKRFYYGTLSEIMLDNYEAGKNLTGLIKLALEFGNRFESEKRKKNIIDFSDMEHLALQILMKKTENGYEPGEVALGYRDFFQEIMVDEYQDSNQVQEYLLESISRQSDTEGNRFMVGDVKQSIYRFRLARPEIFMEKYAAFCGDTGKNRRVNLSCNFRSRKEVIDGVNAVFEALMIPQVGKISYDKDACLYYGADYPETECGNASEILLYEKDAFREQNISEAEAEAKIIAERIRELCRDFCVKDKITGELRKAKYSDIVILLRTATGIDDVMKKVLETEGIPSYISSGKGYFAAPEICIMLNYIKVLNNPRQDIPLVGVLHSVLGGFSEEEIAKIRLFNRKKGRLYDSLTEYAQTGGNANLRCKAEAFIKHLEKWRKKSCFVSVYELLEEILQESGYLQHCMAMPGGTQRRANLLVLLQKAKSFEQGGYSGLFDFIRYIELMQEREIDFGEANVLDESADVVRIMTIHKSKGLEFPICFVAGFSKQFNIRESSEPVLTDADLGMGGDYIDLNLRCRRRSLRKNIIAVKQRNDGRGEDLRILYVAMTRAKEKLIMVGHGSKPEIMKDGATAYEILKAKSFMELVLPVAAVHCELFDIKEFTTGDLKFSKVTRLVEERVLREELQNTSGEQIWSSYVYPHASLEGLFTKTTVSELKKEAYLETEEACHELYEEKEIVPYIPQFIANQEEEAGGSRRGSAYHRIMELMDFTIALKEDMLNECILALRKEAVEALRIPASENELVSQAKVSKFMQTKLAKRMGEAQLRNQLHKEQPFMMAVKGNSVRPNFPEDEDVLIQGVIDVYFEESDGLVLLDYKTDRVSDSNELVKRYEAQLVYYAEALERLTHKKVKEKLIYSFALHEVISL